MTGGRIDLFTVAAGTKIDQHPNGLLIFSPPDALPFTVQVVSDRGRITVVKTEIAPDCAMGEITIGVGEEFPAEANDHESNPVG